MPLPPYAEKVLSDYLRAHADIAALDARVVGKTPSNTQTPWIRLTQLDAPLHRVGRHGEFFCQLDCYAGKDGGQPEANLLARTAAAAIVELDQSNYQADGTVISGASASIGPRIPDEDFEEARERFVVTARVWMHT